ncbi:MAG: translocation/assembly module TamB domain-containing protein [Bacteroides sp.]|nr:translocation/assembly module TamB domain-containing protein [Bacteroides sp.]MCM1412832.1 translocation/assembly module TamB domain-containing protein [Bacteroides sp.]MCM1471501.1 translocation/assembly module TamB domain-containing protein [Bacteroides sp.]
MKRVYKILRALAVSLIALLFVLPALLYVALSMDSVQSWICGKAEKELSTLLNMDVSVSEMDISPFNRMTLSGVSVKDSLGRPALAIERLGAGVNLWSLFTRDRIVVDYVELIGMDARLFRDSIGAPLNIQPAIDALSPKDKNKPPTKFDFGISTVVIRQSQLAYDILNLPHAEAGLDVNHLQINNLKADVLLPQLKNDDFIVDLRRLAFSEQCGLRVENVAGKFHVTAKSSDVKGFKIELPGSLIALNDQRVAYDGFSAMKDAWRHHDFDIKLLPGSHIATTDIAPVVPQLSGMDMVFDAELDATGTLDALSINHLELKSNLGAELTVEGLVAGLLSDEGPIVDIPVLKAVFNSPRALAAVMRFKDVDKNTRQLLGNLGDVTIDATLSGGKSAGGVDAVLTANGVKASLSGNYKKTASGRRDVMAVDGHLQIDDFDGSVVMGGLNSPLGRLTAFKGMVDAQMNIGSGLPDGNAEVLVESAVYAGQQIDDLTLNVEKTGNDITGNLYVDNAMLFADADISANIGPHTKSLDLQAEIRELSLAMLGVDNSAHDRRLSITTNASLRGSSVDDVAGIISIDRILIEQKDKDDFEMDNILLEAIRGTDADTLRLTSQVADASVTGRFKLSTLADVGKAVISQTMPALVGKSDIALDHRILEKYVDTDDLKYNVTLKTLQPIEPLVKLPIGVLQDVDIHGDLHSADRSMSINVDAPFLSQGNKLIENTAIMAGVTGSDSIGNPARGHIYFTTTVPTKNGAMTLVTTAQAQNDCVDSHLEWKVDRDRDFSGDISFATCFSRDSVGNLATNINVNTSRVVFNDTVWTIDASTIAIHGKEIEVHNFRSWRDEQFITITGKVSESPADTIVVGLRDVNLDYVFETLDIQTAMFGGNVTGKVFATRLLTPEPKIFTPGLDVRALTYNHSLLGNALIRSEWINDSKGISLIAEISQPNGKRSFVDGVIYPMADSLNISFDADQLAIGFLKPYMSAFASDVSGYASGTARLYGTFKLIDLVGDVYGEDIALTLGFTNTTYTTTDSVHFRPGRIDLDNLEIKDKYGHTARLNGWVTHECFKSPRFEFRVTDARNLLVYDMPENNEFQWYGRVFGDGGANVSGRPGFVDISVDMTTAPNSTFTYVLSDALSAQDYNFITFRDRDQAKKDSIAAINAPPLFVREFRERMANSNQSSDPSKYKMTFNITITPQALITLVMDPVGGDKIACHGSGILSMTYDSTNEDLRMNGTYTLADGKYNFTLQDIIIKEFEIEPGSSIAFNGDPYAAQLDITAKYRVKANLTDLDESFLEDKELNRTAVPVDAMMMVRGDMRQPDISFDLDFPTITEESRRKIRSIINTDEMMNRQIIYLLALSRFYTPDYMNATRGNELVSVASSTISSQLSNILGQLSDNWNIAPNFRSDRGDFSDMEFDVALSSRLLDNRLLFNGNLGYRDKSLNNNSFIGDFDIEYLLNRSGSLRLKAYNRYNDQNYYLKSALTTQGVGIVFKRDFDNLFSWLRPWRKKKTTPTEETTTIATDSVPETTPTVTNASAAMPTEQPSAASSSSDFIIFR